MFDVDNTLENIVLINSYNAILVGGNPWSVRHRIRSVYGCALRRGIFVDGCSDVGRIDNVHFHGHWWWSPEVGGAGDNPDGAFGLVNQYLLDNLEAFVFGRTDWEYVNNTFVSVSYTHLSALRDASNSAYVLDEIQNKLKVEIKIIPESQEALYAYSSVKNDPLLSVLPNSFAITDEMCIRDRPEWTSVYPMILLKALRSFKNE